MSHVDFLETYTFFVDCGFMLYVSFYINFKNYNIKKTFSKSIKLIKLINH